MRCWLGLPATMTQFTVQMKNTTCGVSTKEPAAGRASCTGSMD